MYLMYIYERMYIYPVLACCVYVCNKKLVAVLPTRILALCIVAFHPPLIVPAKGWSAMGGTNWTFIVFCYFPLGLYFREAVLLFCTTFKMEMKVYSFKEGVLFDEIQYQAVCPFLQTSVCTLQPPIRWQIWNLFPDTSPQPGSELLDEIDGNQLVLEVAAVLRGWRTQAMRRSRLAALRSLAVRPLLAPSASRPPTPVYWSLSVIAILAESPISPADLPFHALPENGAQRSLQTHSCTAASTEQKFASSLKVETIIMRSKLNVAFFFG